MLFVCCCIQDGVSVGGISATNTCEQSTTAEVGDEVTPPSTATGGPLGGAAAAAAGPSSNATVSLPVAGETVTVTGNNDSKEMKQSAGGSRFTIYKVNKASRKKREKSSAKKERKATKTLAIVLGNFKISTFKFLNFSISKNV